MRKCVYLLTILVIFTLFGLKTYAEEDFDDYISDFEDLLPEDMEGETMDRLSVEGILSGVVESVKFEFFGYGNSVVIDHGFGYKTRYAHLKSIGVAEGMKVKRGECIGVSGNSGRS
jgi:hypothetical protein